MASMPESHLPHWLRHAAARFGTFEDGRVNYTHADIAPIILCMVSCGPELLILKRAHHLAGARGYWSGVSGFIDTQASVKRHVQIELEEELGLFVPQVDIRLGDSFMIKYSAGTMSHHVWPAHVSFAIKPDITLDDEHTDYAWVTRGDLANYHVFADLPYIIDRALAI